MKFLNVSGFLALVLIMSVSLSTGYSYVGDWVEKGISSISSVLTFLVIIGLANVWRNIRFYKPKEMMVISILYPLVTIITYIYPLVAYSEQSTPANWFFWFSFDLSLSLFLSNILWKNK